MATYINGWVCALHGFCKLDKKCREATGPTLLSHGDCEERRSSAASPSCRIITDFANLQKARQGCGKRKPKVTLTIGKRKCCRLVAIELRSQLINYRFTDVLVWKCNLLHRQLTLYLCLRHFATISSLY